MTCVVKSKPNRELVGREGARPGEDGARSIRCEFIYRLIGKVRREKGAHGVETQIKTLAGSTTKDSTRSIGREFENSAYVSVFILRYGKDIAGAIYSYSFKEIVSGVAKCTPLSTRSEFQDPATKPVPRGVECSCYKKIADPVKG